MNWTQLLNISRYRDVEPRHRLLQSESRLPFEVDYDRIIFSSHFRSLQDKTQVIPLSPTGFVHTRLTHSLEVSVVGRSLGREVGRVLLDRHKDLVDDGYRTNDFGNIVAAAALAHDIGNPAFGHSGERAMGDFFKTGPGQRFKDQLTPAEYEDLCRFEGNAHGFHLLNKSAYGQVDGLRLTAAVQGAFMKYPKPSLPHKPTSHIAHKKYGVFQADLETWDNLANTMGLSYTKDGEIWYHRHPLTYLVEAADDICYTIIDFEDGINMGLIPEEVALEHLNPILRSYDSHTRKRIYEKHSTLERRQDRIGYLRSVAINVLINDAVKIFLDNEERLLTATDAGNTALRSASQHVKVSTAGSHPFAKAILDTSDHHNTLEDILKISRERMYQSHEVTQKEIRGYQILNTLLDKFVTAIERQQLDRMTAYDKLILRSAGNELDTSGMDIYTRLLETASYVARLSDHRAVQLYELIN